MEEHLKSLVTALRQQLFQAGYMLVLLENTSRLDQGRATTSVVKSVAEVRAHAESVRAASERVNEKVARLARALNLPESSTAPEVVEAAPEHYRMLLEALFRENEDLLSRVRESLETFRFPLPQ
jgi:hypothetical protein